MIRNHIINPISSFRATSLLLLALLFFSVKATAGYGDSTAQKQELIIDKTYPISSEDFDQEALQKYKDDPDYRYDRTFETRSWTDGIWEWIFSKIERLFSNKGVSRTWNIFMYGAFALFLTYIISRMFGMRIGNLFYKPNQTNAIEYEIIDENIHEMDFNQLIQAAIDQKMYRKAVRLYYLKSLKVLSEKDIIQWKINKTNSDYRREVQQSKYASSFSEITFLFDHIWYGEFPVDESVFKNTQNKFNQFISNV